MATRKNFKKEITQKFLNKKNTQDVGLTNKNSYQIDNKNFFKQQLSKPLLNELKMPHFLKKIQDHLQEILHQLQKTRDNPPPNLPTPKFFQQVHDIIVDISTIITEFLNEQKQNGIKTTSLLSEEKRIKLDLLLKQLKTQDDIYQKQEQQKKSTIEAQKHKSWWDTFMDAVINVVQVAVGAFEMAVGDEAGGALDLATGAVGLVKDTCKVLKETGVCSGDDLDGVIKYLNIAQMVLQCVAVFIDIAGAAFKAVRKIGKKVTEKVASKEFTEGVKDILEERAEDMEEQIKDKVNDLFNSVKKDLKQESQLNSFEMEEFSSDASNEPERFDGTDEDVIDEPNKKISKVNDKALNFLSDTKQLTRRNSK